VDRNKLIEKRDALRENWRALRFEKLKAKAIAGQLPSGASKNKALREYKKLRKEQKKISTLIKHVEKRISKALNEKAKK